MMVFSCPKLSTRMRTLLASQMRLRAWSPRTESFVNTTHFRDYSTSSSSAAPTAATSEPRGMKKEPKSRFAEQLLIDIKARGPMSISTFMIEALTNPKYGYYTTRKEVFGRQGDFVTSPEISQMFGELVAIWCISVWESLGRPQKVNLVELGPGRGSLMADILRVSLRFAEFSKSVEVTFVELESPLRETQRKAVSAVAPSIPLTWVDNVDRLQTDVPLIVVAHEFFDAIPVHRFQKTERGWCEILVEMDESNKSEQHFRFVAMGKPTLRNLIVPEQRLRSAKIGDCFETSPKSILIIEHLLQRIGKQKGAALLIDYGNSEGWIKDSLRGIREHQMVPFLSLVGETDLSADVDFVGFRDYVTSRRSAFPVLASRIMTQRDFLIGLGIDVRLLQLMVLANENQALDLAQSYARLIDPQGMGQQYKCLCLYHTSLPAPPPWS